MENVCKTNSNATVTYNPTDGDYANVRDEWFDSLADELQLCTHGHIQDKFSQSIKDSEFDGMHDGKKPRTRDRLKQMIEGSCSDCDLISEEGINEFVCHLTKLRSYCNAKKGIE